MTPTEWGRLQGFIGYGFVDGDGVDHFSFPEGTARAQQYKQFGNSVTIPVIEELAHFMLECFEKMMADQTSLIVNLVRERECISKRDVMECLEVSKNQAGYLLKKLVAEGKLSLVGSGKQSKYILN